MIRQNHKAIVLRELIRILGFEFQLQGGLLESVETHGVEFSVDHAYHLT